MLAPWTSNAAARLVPAFLASLLLWACKAESEWTGAESGAPSPTDPDASASAMPEDVQRDAGATVDPGTSAATAFAYGRLPAPPPEGRAIPLLSRVVPILEGHVGPEQIAHLVLDTGSWFTVVSSTGAARLGLPVRPVPPRSIDAASGAVTVRAFARFARLTLAGMEVTPLDAVLIDLPFDVTGVLGLSVFGEYPTLVDASLGEARLLSLGSVERILAARYPDRTWSRHPLQWTGRFPWVELTAGGVRLRMLVDTGATQSGLGPGAIAELGLTPVRRDRFVQVDAAGELVLEQAVFELEGLGLGRWECSLEGYADEGPLLISAHVDGVLGFDFLGGIPFVFDGREGSLWVIDPLPGEDATLCSSQDSRRQAFIRDPLPLMRKFAAASVARSGDRRMLPLVAALLDDDAPEVRDEAARTLFVFAQVNWPEDSRREDARRWWELHKNDLQFAGSLDGGR